MTHRQAGLILALLYVALFGPTLLRGHVIFPHDNAPEVGMPSDPGGTPHRARFRDQDSQFVPVLHEHLRGDGAGWLATWNPHVELGRPTWQHFGFGKAFAPIGLVALFDDDPLRVYTLQAIAAAVLTGVFGHLFLRSLRLGPAACLVGGIGLSAGTGTLYMLCLSLLIWTRAWSLALLWLVTSFVRRPTAGYGLAIVAAVHALVLTGYPQYLVWNGTLIVAHSLWMLTSLDGGRVRMKRFLALGCLALLGVASLAPVLFDLYLNASLSPRLDVDESFFLSVVAKVGSWRDAAAFGTQVVDSFWYGNPTDDRYRLAFGYMGLSLPWAVLVALALRPAVARRAWVWWVALAVSLILAVSETAMSLGVRSGVLALSQLSPLLGTSLVWFVLAAFAVDDLIRKPRDVRTSLALATLPLAVALLGVAATPRLVDPMGVAAGIVLFAACAAGVVARRPAAFAAIALVSTLWYGPRMILDRSPESIRLDSPLIESLREHTERGSRFAQVGPVPLVSNQEGLLGLRSIHTYNPLMTETYRAWVPTVAGKEIPRYSRHFQALASVEAVGTPAFSFTGVDVLVTREGVSHPELELVRVHNGLRLYRVRSPAPLEAQVAVARPDGVQGFRIDGDLREVPRLPARRVEDRDDRLVFETSSTSEPSLLFVSQQFHPQWLASSGATSLQTVRVNDLYQGVVVPPGVEVVTLEFAPAARWSWLPPVGFVVAAGVVGVFHGRARRRAA